MPKKLTATLEDYLRAVLVFQRQKRFARVSDIAASLGVAKSAVSAALQRLAEKGLLNYTAYEPVTLTPEGEEQAERILLRHQVILDFLVHVLALQPERAATVAEDMEHAIDPATLERFVCFLAFVGTRSEDASAWLSQFHEFTADGLKGQTCKDCMKDYLRKVRDELVNSAE